MNEKKDDIAEHLAANLRHVRKERGLTQARLARLCSVPRSTIANVETGLGNPTLSVLAKLAAALRLSIEELISAPRGRCELFPRGTLLVVERGRTGQTIINKLLPHPIAGMEIDRMEIGADERVAGVPHRPGTQEYLYCERGRITLWVTGERFDLAEGDVAAFPGDTRHSYHNPGNRPAIGFSVVTLAPVSRSRTAS